MPVLALLLVTACTAPGAARPRPHWAADQARGQVARHSAHTVVGPRAGLDAATVVLDSGVTGVTVRVADLGGDLFRVRTPDGSSVVPVASRSGADVRLTTAGTGLGGAAALDVTLHRAVRWQVRLGGGARDAQVDLRDGAVSGVEFVAGFGRIALTLPPPRGTVPVRMSGGADSFRLVLPGDAPVRVRVGGGAGSVVVDGVTRTGVPGGTVVEGPTWAAAADRYDVDLAAGVSRLVLDRG
ncbi:hypothetical protein [Asanoa siamensis]|uniref:hypothetical protein n=1 Tax=Asanoa siamensis TaxID=926357 RepID=UPI0019440778|nr:hypothetical protein [Asanoa siamensis]